MATKTVTTYTCDRCGEEDRVESRHLRPPGWAEVEIDQTPLPFAPGSSELTDDDDDDRRDDPLLCPKCVALLRTKVRRVATLGDKEDHPL